MAEPLIEVRQSAEFAEWMARLRDVRGRAKIAARIDRLAMGHADDVRPVGAGISELRIPLWARISRLLCASWLGCHHAAVWGRQEQPKPGHLESQKAGHRIVRDE